MKLGDIIYNYRQEHNLSMQEFADLGGISKGYVSMLEKGQHPQSDRPLIPSIKTLSKVAAAMKMSTDALLVLMDENQLVSLKPEPEVLSLSDTEQRLIDSFRQLNDEGQEELMKHINMMIASGLYIKNHQAGLVQEEA